MKIKLAKLEISN